MVCGYYSKSMFGSYDGTSNVERLMTHPLGNVAKPLIVSETVIQVSPLSDLSFNQYTLNALKEIEEKYTANLAGKNYDSIPTSYPEYVRLYHILSGLQISTVNDNLRLLFKITQEGLTGAMNAFGLNTDVIELNLKTIILQNQVNQLESGVNVRELPTGASGQFVIKKAFTLAPVFSYYIALFGMPAYGVGFKPDRVATLEEMLRKHGIDPYG